ncbi:flagellar basal-body rod modification protein FlgD [Roseomonas rosea]|jgi:flagellar basal-body rod modification protein FlgD|uniref:Basal-body rod modification protein FlgD n=1 Tax=Muricoccus roseus TaxID=198092 RepID=A0A1M6QXY8_9PROT|nr:flagellar hook assembly protein FlgD [Roseomonas rosea]SHK25101.1 flagellar basal-body rod modification protein FlgD [Roseomonas rosea]
MAVSGTATTGTTTGTTNSASTTARTQLAGSFDNFLTLLTTQLKNQSPTDPLDTNQMTAQLVQFASVEQQIAMNKNLEQMVSLQQAAQLTAAAPMLGQRVEVQGDTLPLQDGSATVRLPAAGAARTARVAVLDSSGKTLREAQVPLGSSSKDWVWDGRDSSGKQLPDGAYRVAVTGADASGGAAATSFSVIGTATAAERVDGTLRLRMGAASYTFDKVRSIAAGS